jgi:small GTP-binding protein
MLFLIPLGVVVALIAAATVLALKNPPPTLPPHVKVMVDNTQRNARESLLEALLKESRACRDLDFIKRYNLAIIGQTGAGKSSLHNRMRGLNDSNADASPVGETETTQRFFSRNHPIFTHLALCDHPGAGARRHPVATYVKDNWLRCYDGVLLVTATRFFENDIKIAKELHDARVPIFFIRNKMLIDAKQKSMRDGISKEEAIEQLKRQVKQNISEELSHSVKESEIFCVDTNKLFHDSLDGTEMFKHIAEMIVNRRARN